MKRPIKLNKLDGIIQSVAVFEPGMKAEATEAMRYLNQWHGNKGNKLEITFYYLLHNNGDFHYDLPGANIPLNEPIRRALVIDDNANQPGVPVPGAHKGKFRK